MLSGVGGCTSFSLPFQFSIDMYGQSHVLPYILEDRTGVNTASDFDEMYDRVFYRIARVPLVRATTTMIYEMGTRASRHRDTLPVTQPPIVILDFQEDESLGTISYLRPTGKTTELMSRYLKKTGLFSSKFMGSDGQEYRWSHRSVVGQEWTCTVGADHRPIAHYDLKPPNVNAYGISGHTLTVEEEYVHVLVELLASFTIMRHIALHNL
ncbi:hypothetical protein CPB85DRAFT_203864 [Mucidula mucida]|nr:hypothetical protein CPB85DRAFT_203864 [Mucidula mucida]